MPLQKLDHVNVRTHDLDRAIEFYGRVLDLKPGSRPAFPFPGAWLYCGDQAVVHLVTTSKQPPAYRSDQSLEHYALSATDLAGFLAHLRAQKVSYKCGVLPGDGWGHTQVNIFDADGNHLHIDFPPGEEADITEYDGR
ncbi:MAG: VOC family protein [Alphaproteobacteria bacterium]|nr:VOC family protein [Alphaproteobacteria bacterium]